MTDFLLVNKTFWPKSKTIGEGHLQVVSRLSEDGIKSGVFFEDCGNFDEEFKKRGIINLRIFKVNQSLRNDSSIIYKAISSILYTLKLCKVLISERPKNIYIATDPPIVSAFIVMLYSKIFKAGYIYHLQDIHPEITNRYMRLNPFIYNLLLKIDKAVMRNADEIITINSKMKEFIESRGYFKKITTLPNPAIFQKNDTNLREKSIAYCGNFGRFQYMDIIIEAIDKYLSEDGSLKFYFIGDGPFKNKIIELSKKHKNVIYEGYLPSDDCSKLLSRIEFSLLPFQEGIDSLAFPSKSSTYLACGNKIISICEDKNFLKEWVENNNLGININPSVELLVKFFQNINTYQNKFPKRSTPFMMNELTINHFSNTLKKVILRNWRK